MAGCRAQEYKKNFEIVSSLETEQPMLKLSYLSGWASKDMGEVDRRQLRHDSILSITVTSIRQPSLVRQPERALCLEIGWLCEAATSYTGGMVYMLLEWVGLSEPTAFRGFWMQECAGSLCLLTAAGCPSNSLSLLVCSRFGFVGKPPWPLQLVFKTIPVAVAS